jgi:hypothetical protein
LQVDYGQADVALGNNLSPEQATHQPSIFFIGEEDSYYTLVMVRYSHSLCIYTYINSKVYVL